MEKLDKKDWLNIFLVIIIYLGIALTITFGTYVFGSTIDWGFQHFAFPQYFRLLFYKTHNLFPNFALNIGGGQNIFYFAYYGLLSPIILISYLLPFVPMYIYIILISLIMGIISIILLYKWLKSFKFSKNLCLVLTLLFACASPLLFQAHRHIMFVNYMPFVIMGLMGVQKYFEKGNRTLLIISVFLMIMTNYFYCVGGLLCLTVYGIYEYLKRNKFNFSDFIKQGFKFALNIILGIFMSFIILLPVIYTLKNGRGVSAVSVPFKSVVWPKLGLEYILYKPYSVGLTAISLLSVCYLILMKKKEIKFLGISLLCLVVFPIFVYLLNGGLYLDGKAFIPFLPLFILVIGIFLREVLTRKVDLKKLLIIFIFLSLWALIEKNNFAWFFIVDGLISFLSIYIYYKFKKEEIVFIPLIVISVFICLGVNLSDTLILNSDFAKQNDPKLVEMMNYISKKDKGLYRTAVNIKASSQTVNNILNVDENVTTIYSSTYNTSYNKFYYTFNNNMSSRNMFITNEVKNSLFESFMGVKYLITDKAPTLGYKVFKRYGDYTIYINENSLPLGFATDRLISNKEFNKLTFPDNIYALMNNVVTRKKGNSYLSPFTKIDLDLLNSEKNNLTIVRNGSGYKVTVKTDEPGILRIKLDESVKNKYYLLRFNMSHPQSCSQGDTVIGVNYINNKLTCKQWKYFNGNYTFDYTLSSAKRFRYLNISFSKGVHYIDSTEMYSISYDDVKNIKNGISPLVFDKKVGDELSGKINVLKDGYFMFTIPYDNGFTIKVDGKNVNYEKVNQTFIGFPIKKGKHSIVLSYSAPNFKMGKICSFIGILIYIYIVYDEKKKKN
jgi:uncharacterized membrane protein YfhO